jgi:demethylmacrocin O-methyltransferase
MIGRLVIDSSEIISDLCILGRNTNTDKSPYNTIGHRHPYTGVYSMLFAPLKGKPIRFAEIGVAMGASALLWDEYFTNENTQIHLFDRDQILLDNSRALTGPRVQYALMDVAEDGDIRRALGYEEYDVILDDSTHRHGDQIRIIHEAFPLLKSGGMLIIEDIFKSTPEEDYTSKLQDIIPKCSNAYFVVCEHKWRWSPGWDNDKLLVLVKG